MWDVHMDPYAPLSFIPLEHDGRDIGRTHERLTKRVNAVIDMHEIGFRGRGDVHWGVVIWVQALAQHVLHDLIDQSMYRQKVVRVDVLGSEADEKRQ